MSRFVVMDSGVFTGHERMGEAWLRFGDFVARVPKLPVKRLMRIGRKSPLPPEILGASQAPFPNAKSKAGARAFPQLIPSPPRRPVLRPVRRSPGRSKNARPVLLLRADSDPMLPLETLGRQAQDLFLAAEKLTVIEDAGHFLQEDQGEHIGTLIADRLPSK